jgi:hypothetical protein
MLKTIKMRKGILTNESKRGFGLRRENGVQIKPIKSKQGILKGEVSLYC